MRKIQIRLTVVASAVSVMLAGCGGGGGGGGPGGGGNPYLRSSVPYHTPVRAGTFQPHTVSGPQASVADIFARDLNNDAVDEVVIGGRMTAQTNVANHGSSNLQIYGWNTGRFASETTSWFSGTDNQILGSEPAIKFGDFNGDGRIDMFVAPSTDMTLYGPGVAYLNAGNRFTRSNINFGNVWAHDVAVTDLNGDGFADIFVPDYNMRPAVAFGSASGAFTVVTATTNQTGASGVSVADFLGNGTKTLVMSDAGQGTFNRSDTNLYSWSTATGSLVLTAVAALPENRFYLSKWDSVRTSAGVTGHEVRNLAYDFNGDGRTDVIVISTMPQGTNAHGYTEVQFLRNNGGGNFSDVTDSELSGFNTNKSATYQPMLIDVNNDGLLDIFMSATDYSGQASTSVLVATREGVFVEQYTSTFADFATQIKNLNTIGSGNHGGTQVMNIIRGPNNVNYLVSTVQYVDAGTTQTAVYLAQIGTFGTVTAQASVATLQSTWPWMSAVTANESLARTALTNFAGYDAAIHGNGIIDLWSALNPIGGLGISLDGRTGPRRSIEGSISVPGLDGRALSNISAVDGLGRNFAVDLSGMTTQPGFMPVNYSMSNGTDVTQNWSSRFIAGAEKSLPGFSIAGDNQDNFSSSVTTRQFGWNSAWTHRIGVTRMSGSPWFGFSGIFGKVQNSTMLDFTATRTWSEGFFAQAGMIQTATQFSPGLVTDITPIWAGYAVTGWQDQAWTVYTGLQPTVFAGSMTLRLPTSVDQAGVMHYTEHKFNIRNQPVAFAGMERRWQQRQHSVKFSGVVNDQGTYQTRLAYSYDFQ
jgi:hypothetical protein